MSAAAAQPASWQALDRLHTDLHLTASQETAWADFSKAYSMSPQEIAKQQRAQSSMQTMTGPQRVDLSIELAKENLVGLQRRGDALKSFYATLSPQQQKTFDQDTLPPAGNP